MITVTEAENILSQHLYSMEDVETPLEKSYGLVLKEDLYADRDFPACNKSTMDGIAINFNVWKQGTRAFLIEDVQAAGQPETTLTNKSGCYEIMTGAVLPIGCDCVIPVEEIDIKDNQAIIKDGVNVRSGQFFIPQGADRKEGELLLKKGEALNGSQIAVAASIGKSVLRTAPKIEVAIVSTGDELLDVTDEVQPHQIRKSNSYAIETALLQLGLCTCSRYHVKDNKRTLLRSFKRYLEKFDMIVISGGVSMGKFDFIPEVLDELDFKTVFHKVTQRPGKPLLFALSQDNQPVFGLPGNPVSTQVCLYRYVLPYIKSSLGHNVEHQTIKLGETIPSLKKLTWFCPVTLNQNKGGEKQAFPVNISGSGDLVSFAQADGFVEIINKGKAGAKESMVKLFTW